MIKDRLLRIARGLSFLYILVFSAQDKRKRSLLCALL